MDFNGDTQDRAKLNLNDISANDGVLPLSIDYLQLILGRSTLIVVRRKEILYIITSRW